MWPTDRLQAVPASMHPLRARRASQRHMRVTFACFFMFFSLEYPLEEGGTACGLWPAMHFKLYNNRRPQLDWR